MHCLEESSHLYFSAADQISLILQKQQQKSDMVLQDALSAVDDAKLFYKIIRFENHINIFYDKTVTTAEEHNIDLSELSW